MTMEKNTPQPAAWRYLKEHDGGLREHRYTAKRHRCPEGSNPQPPYPAPPVPRDVLMALANEVLDETILAIAEVRDASPVVHAIADRYAGKVQPVNQQLQDVAQRLRNAGATLPAPPPGGTIESAMNHGLCIALALVEEAVAATDAAQPVNQQLLAALKPFAADDLAGVSAVVDGKTVVIHCADYFQNARAAIAAAEAAQPVGPRECGCGWRGESADCVWCGNVGPLCPKCHETTEEAQQPASAQPVAVPATRELTDDELWAIRNHVAINEVTRDDDSRTICIKQGRAVIRAMLSAAQKPDGV